MLGREGKESNVLHVKREQHAKQDDQTPPNHTKPHKNATPPLPKYPHTDTNQAQTPLQNKNHTHKKESLRTRGARERWVGLSLLLFGRAAD